MSDTVLPPDLLRFVELFNRGEFWESHEALEVPWRVSRSRFYHGMILLASAYVHVGRGNAKGVAAQLRKALRELPDHRPAYLGVDVAALVTLAETALASLESGREAPLREHLPTVTLALDPERVRGDEPEMKEKDMVTEEDGK